MCKPAALRRLCVYARPLAFPAVITAAVLFGLAVFLFFCFSFCGGECVGVQRSVRRDGVQRCWRLTGQCAAALRGG